MPRLAIALAGLAALGLVAWVALFSVTYQGRRIWLTYPLLDVDAFKNARSNISERQAKRVARLLFAAPIAARYGGVKEVLAATGALRFPGYGSSALPIDRPGGQKMTLVCIEVPRLDEDRCLLFRDDGGYVLVEDFVAKGPIRSVSLSERGPTYVAPDGEPVRVMPTSARLRELG